MGIKSRWTCTSAGFYRFSRNRSRFAEDGNGSNSFTEDHFITIHSTNDLETALRKKRKKSSKK